MARQLLSQEEFMKLSPRQIEEMTGVARPDNMTEAELQQYLHESWRSYQIDVGNAEEWGNARQESEVEPDA